uniref:Uncharacterized protein n=1 Tax=Nelumbo nucifera TaxID=4432 RepID=A0A822ZDN9_NELNU|nr:TPA_asm: hypothetical protein HUJ06_015892 [Nelumbo nucifera]
MSQNDALSAKGSIPFSWENKPGLSKVVTHHDNSAETTPDVVKLPPPPYYYSGSPKARSPELQIPLPPCPFLPPSASKSSSRKSLRRQEDPFLAAYKECTKSVKNSKSYKDSKKDFVKKSMFRLSCKHSCAVRDDSLVKLSHLPRPGTPGEKF